MGEFSSLTTTVNSTIYLSTLSHPFYFGERRIDKRKVNHKNSFACENVLENVCHLFFAEGPAGQFSEFREEDEKYLETLHSLLSLQAHVREIEDANMCAICLEKRRNVAFLCGHGTCKDCASSLEVCPMCRKPISQKIKLFN